MPREEAEMRLEGAEMQLGMPGTLVDWVILRLVGVGIARVVIASPAKRGEAIYSVLFPVWIASSSRSAHRTGLLAMTAPAKRSSAPETSNPGHRSQGSGFSHESALCCLFC